MICVKGKRQYVHRLIYRRKVGKIPRGYEVDHLCRVRSCVRPSHLEAVTKLENIRRAIPYRPTQYKTICVNGHDKTDPNNTYVDPRGNKNCVACKNMFAEQTRRRAGMRKRGTFIPRYNVTLTEKEVLKIRRLYRTGKYSQSQLGKKFGVSQSSVGRYIRGDRYADLPLEGVI